MRSLDDIRILLDELAGTTADDLETQDLDFKEWDASSMKAAVAMVVEMAICMANGGGGTVVFGVADKIVGRAQAIKGVPPDVDVNLLKRAVYDNTDPKLTPIFETLAVPEGTGRLIVMQVYPGLPPYTDTAGKGRIRVGKDCKPLTGTLRRKMMVETGETDYTAVAVSGVPRTMLSPSALEQLREAARHELAPDDLLKLGDLELLQAVGVLRHGKLLRAGVFLAGKEQAIQEHFPGYVWTHLRMKSDTDYADRMDGRDALPVALNRILDRINADNPITTVTHGPHHFEYRTYPEIALREAAMNAFYHADYRLAGPILVKQYGSKLEISNPGGLVGDITPQNILHHQPLARNPCLVDALTRLRLVNRSNVGIQRMFSTLLMEGKEPPQIVDHGQSVIVTFRAMPSSAPFRAFVAEESKRSRILTVDHLLVLLHLLREPEVDVTRAAQLCQRTENEMREVLVQMEREWGYLGRGGAGRGVYWALRPELHQKLAAPGHPDRDRRIDWEAAKTRVLSVLKQRAKRGEPGLSNADVRRITALGRSQVKRLMDELRAEASVRLGGKGRCAKWTCGGAMD